MIIEAYIERSETAIQKELLFLFFTIENCNCVVYNDGGTVVAHRLKPQGVSSLRFFNLFKNMC
ncbi:hypothetical protein bcgnr5390_15280 [Bacillus luti]|nr:hypothetical protein BC2903_46290 [Bacillus cereus]